MTTTITTATTTWEVSYYESEWGVSAYAEQCGWPGYEVGACDLLGAPRDFNLSWTTRDGNLTETLATVKARTMKEALEQFAAMGY